MRSFIKFIVRNLPRTVLIRFSYLFSVLVSPFYKGSRYQCPVCESKLRKLLPYGNKGAVNRLCPVCLSLERHRMLWLYLQRKTSLLNSEAKVLHIAPEQSIRRNFKKLQQLHYTTADLNSPIADLHFDVMNIPLPDNSFDVVLCNHVLEHVPDDIAAMQQIYRIMKPGAWSVMQVPLRNDLETTFEDVSITSPAEREKVFGQYDHVRWHGRDYPKRLEKAGFVVEEFDPAEYFSEHEINLFRLDRNEKMYIAHKPL